MKKILVTLIALVLSTGVSFGADHKANIIVVTHGSDTDAFWGVVRNGVEAARQTPVQMFNTETHQLET